MPVLVTCKFDEEPINYVRVIVYDNFFQCSRARNTEVNDPIRLEFDFV